MKWFAECEYRRNNWFSMLGVLVMLILVLAPVAQAAGQIGVSQTQVQQSTPLTAAQEDITNMAQKIITNYVLAGQPLTFEDIKMIDEDLELGIRPFEAKFSGEFKHYLYLVEAIMAHYQGNRALALQKAQQAYDALERSPIAARTSAELIVSLSLCYGDFATAKDLLSRMKAGSALATQGTNVSPATQNITQPARFDPNNPRRTVIPPTGTRQPPVTTRRSRWANTGIDNTLQANTNRNTALNQMMGGDPAGQFGAPAGTGQEAAETLFKLPVLYMPYENLGEDFSTLSLRGIEGSYFHFEPGKGQMLFALLWTLPANQGTGLPVLRQPLVPEFAPQNVATGTSDNPVPAAVPAVAYDLSTNADQFRQLFQNLQPYILDGKARFVGINFDPADEYMLPEIASLTFGNSWPWTTCVMNEWVNQPQWQLDTITGGTVMMLVDTRGKVRYVGPVGGFLPKMIMDTELAQARPLQSNQLPNLSLAAGGQNEAERAQKAEAERAKEQVVANGIIAGRNFVCEKATLRNGVLHLTQGEGIFPDLELEITLFLKGASPARKIYNVNKQSGINSPYVSLKWIPAGEVLPTTERFTSNYEMHLEFGDVSDGKIPGKINIVLPNKRCEVTGEFVADIKGQ